MSRASTEAPAIKGGATIHERALENGLRVLVVERHLDPIVAVTLWYRVGSRDEREHEAGLSHFLEHMMFKGAARFGKGEVDRLVTELGGGVNAFTSHDHTGYWFELASDRWEVALEIEADRMASLALDPGEFDAERAVVLDELAMGLDDPWRSLSQEVQELVFPRHPYHRPIIGYADVLRNLTVEDMREYHRRFYHPGNATLVVAGDVDPEVVLERARAQLGAIPRGPEPSVDRFRPELGEPPGELRLRTRWDDPAHRLCLAWPTVRVGTPDDHALDIVLTLLAGGRLSRLHRHLVLERGLATSVSASNDTRVDGGAFWIFGECVEGVEPVRLEDAITEELETLARDPVGDVELARAKAILSAMDAYQAESISDLAEDLGEYAVDADWRLCLEGPELRERVGAAEVQDVVQRLLGRDRRVVGTSLGTREEPKGPQEPQEPQEPGEPQENGA